jgi:hypothetical protein
MNAMISNIYATYSVGNSWKIPSIESMYSLIKKIENDRNAYIEKFGHEPINDIRENSNITEGAYCVLDGIMYVSNTDMTKLLFDMWMTKIESEKN